ncbi:MAG: zinc ribbon domain-containing protein [Anaerolineales bacterium]|nr:zinc ribbon domain-containing protein [Anaerolineales bacterium]
MSDITAAITCGNCGRPLDGSDRFCRECGLPTVRQAGERHRVPVLDTQPGAAPPDTRELRRAFNVQARPAWRAADPADTAPPETTSDVVRATSPTQAVRMASSTLLMLIGLMVFLAAAGVILLWVALR